MIILYWIPGQARNDNAKKTRDIKKPRITRGIFLAFTPM